MADADIHELRATARREAAAPPIVMADLPTGTYERVRLPDGAPVPEVWLYRPESGPEPPGVFVSLHGGGFVLGDPSVDDRYCRYLANRTGCAVVNLDYLLAPEHPFPAAVEQVYAVLDWLATRGADGVDGSRLAVGGHSAGGNLSAAACLLARERGGPALRGQVIDYAPLDLLTPPSRKTAPGLPDDDARLEAQVGARFNAWYLRTPDDAANPIASPVLADDLTGLPPALVVTAELDTLRAEGDRYAERLVAAGVPTEHAVFAGCRHGFTHAGPEAQAVEAWERMAAFVRRVLA